jgi:hypothetical protein
MWNAKRIPAAAAKMSQLRRYGLKLRGGSRTIRGLSDQSLLPSKTNQLK